MTATNRRPSHRPESMAHVVRAEISRLLIEKMRDPQLGFVTVADVVMSPDLKQARIYVSVMGGGPEAGHRALNVLAGAQGFLRGELGRALKMRFTPNLSFFLVPDLPLSLPSSSP